MLEWTVQGVVCTPFEGWEGEFSLQPDKWQEKKRVKGMIAELSLATPQPLGTISIGEGIRGHDSFRTIFILSL